jgi:hypothetical protein
LQQNTKNIIKMKNLLLIFALIGITLNTAAQDSCVDYKVSDKNIAIVKAVAESVENVSSTTGELLEEQPEAELALAVVEVTAKVVGAIADAFKAHSMGSPTPIAINWNAMNEKPRYWKGGDGDTVVMTRTPGTGKLTFAQTGLTWWKGIVAFSKSDTNKWWEIACLQDKRTAMTMTLTPSLANTHYITLSKAKTFGVHTNMYLITNWSDADTRYDYTFNWVKD